MENNFQLTDKVIIVTGGTGILGSAFAEAISNAGAKVGILGRNKQKATAIGDEIRKKGGAAIELIADVLNEEQLHSAKEKILAKYGKIDGLVNAAGGNLPGAVVQDNQSVFELNLTAQKEVMDLNLFGTLLPVQVFGKSIAENSGGSIVNISSMTAQRAVTKVLGYSLAKSAIDCYTRWMSVEFGKRYGDALRINAIAPGFFLTEQNKNLLTEGDKYSKRGETIIGHTPFKRFGQPNELIGALQWLLSDASKFTTGLVINIDGGFSAFSGV